MSTLDTLLEEFPFPEFRELAQFWRGYGGEDTLPKWRSLDLIKAYRIAAKMVVLDAEGELDGDCRFKWRYAGSLMRTLAGFEITGMYDEQVFRAEKLETTRSIYTDVLRQQRPHAWRHHVISDDRSRDHIHYHRLVLPLGDDEGRARHLIGVYHIGF